MIQQSSTSMVEEVRSSVDEWKAARALLSTAVQSYLSACNSLAAACTRPARTLSECDTVENTLVLVDAELDAMSSEIQSLGASQLSMSTLRNRSSRLTRINVLPPEILRHIFRLSTTECVRDARAKGCYNALSRVDMYWRQVSLDTPELWTHIDVSPTTATRSLYELSRTLLERSKGEPVHLHVYEPQQTLFGGITSEGEVYQLTKFLSPYIPRVVGINLETETQSARLVHSVMRLWSKIGTAKITDFSAKLLPSQFCDHLSIPSGCGLPEVISSTRPRTLHLKDIQIDWESSFCRNLFDFRLQSCGDFGIDLAPKSLEKMLLKSPKLSVLKLHEVAVTKGRLLDEEISPVTLESLRVLNLVKLDLEPLQLVLSLIHQPNPLARLSVGLTFYDELTDEYRAFFSRCHVSTLYLESPAEHLSLPCLPSGLSHLIIFQSDLSQPPFIHAPLADSQPRAIVYVTLVSCVVTLEGLVSLVAETGAQVLNLDCCLTDRLMDLEGTVNKVCDETRSELVEVYPDLVCSVSDVDTTAGMACRTIFDD
ncbi:F-box-like protein [Ceratobasidium sp. AG-Ba]|nr:F-box-like protein [Ceratobasidium sp. AG-Ba]